MYILTCIRVDAADSCWNHHNQPVVLGSVSMHTVHGAHCAPCTVQGPELLDGRCPDRKITLDLSCRSTLSCVLRGLFLSPNAVRLRSFSAALKIDRQKYGQHGEWDPLCKTGDFHVLSLLNTPLHGTHSGRQLPQKLAASRGSEERRRSLKEMKGSNRLFNLFSKLFYAH